ncbi:MAG: chemotaxis response regulator protein-glutamate methylesterase [Pseudomonadota bacterium]|nr:chemotaxis response regulator protein-glutamate methylesterase [Pseudomonadota bacterium]
MPTNVLVVDDSAFFRRRIKDILEKNPALNVVGFADNGKVAVEKVKELKPDVITMDYEMPLLDGISAVRQIMSEQPTPILMFSSLSYEGARVTLDALEAGALDYLPKSFESMSGDPGDSAKLLQDRVLAISRRGATMRRATPAAAPRPPATTPSAASAPKPKSTPAASVARTPVPVAKETAASKPVARSGKSPLDSLEGERPRIVLIGASTGGPVALQNILMSLPANYPFPLLLVQHMPGTFTSAFAERLNRLCKINVKEAADNDPIRPGTALLAPGGKQMLVEGNAQSVSIIEGDDRIQYRPSVDVTFGSAARSIRGKVLALVLTGMGSDGREGCKLLKRNGATIWTQNEQSCVVYGMPMAVATAGLSDAVIDVKDVGTLLGELR